MDTARPPIPRSQAALPGPQPRLLVDQGDTEACYQPQSLLARLGGILAQRCPVCLGSPAFRDPWHMYDKCAGCGHHHRQPVGVARAIMHVVCGVLSLAMAAGLFLGLVYVVIHLLPRESGLESAIMTAFGIQLLFVPGIYRYTRVLWAHLSVRTKP